MKYISPIHRPSADSLSGQVYSQIKQEFGVIADPFRVHSPIPELLAAVWSVAREIRVAKEVVWPIKETVAAAVSQSNLCQYCVEIHAAVASVNSTIQLGPLLMQDRTKDIDDSYLKAIITWAQSTRSYGSAALMNPPFAAKEAPEIIGTALMYHYINRMVNIFLPESLLPSFLHVGKLDQLVWRMVVRKLVHSRGKELEAGASLHFLPIANFHTEFSWALPSPVISRALAGFTEVIDRIGEETLRPQVRDFVTNFLNNWQGEVMPLSRTWVNGAVAKLPVIDQAMGKLALLAAVSPHQIDDEIIDVFRMRQPGDIQLIGVTAWASFQAARRIASWLYVSVNSELQNQIQYASSQNDMLHLTEEHKK